ncbi:MAG: nicotinamide-nucleotide amidohydrolase family protein [Coxiellaceae bacterium]|nr:nicotinamide-nucleotide amidohydrolase family protein [Coxiellaceae bacterium]
MSDNPYVLCKKLGELCGSKNVTLSLAESCTGGLLSSWITETPGVSQWFYGSACVYSNAAKTALLGVDAAVIDAEGAVSEAVAKAMASGAATRYRSTLALSITGIAGPLGGSIEKPVGTVCFALFDARTGRGESKTMHFSSGRAYIRQSAAIYALNWLIDWNR